MMRNINKIIALGLLLFLFSGIYFFSMNYDPLQTEDEDMEVSKSQSNRDFEEMFGIKSEEPSEITENKADYRLEIFEQDNGWGYKIYAGQKVVIDQTHIPAISGVVAFYDKEQAEKTGKLVIAKIQSGIFPPTISITELDSLGVEY
ncbi:MAG: DUF4907 domain-containing protein [Bacteroidetes bacterium]|nr:DUF4907 domain-containing protein [Bacteroidota bacterium]